SGRCVLGGVTGFGFCSRFFGGAERPPPHSFTAGSVGTSHGADGKWPRHSFRPARLEPGSTAQTEQLPRAIQLHDRVYDAFRTLPNWRKAHAAFPAYVRVSANVRPHSVFPQPLPSVQIGTISSGWPKLDRLFVGCSLVSHAAKYLQAGGPPFAAASMD